MEILNYIKKLIDIFNSNSEISAQMYYTRGGCYKFASMLKVKYPEGKIVVTTELLHVMFLYKEHYYDVDGLVTDESLKVIATEDEFPSALIKILKSYDCDIETREPKTDYLDVYDKFSFNEQEDIYNFCIAHDCNGALAELEWREV